MSQLVFKSGWKYLPQRNSFVSNAIVEGHRVLCILAKKDNDDYYEDKSDEPIPSDANEWAQNCYEKYGLPTEGNFLKVEPPFLLVDRSISRLKQTTYK